MVQFLLLAAFALIANEYLIAHLVSGEARISPSKKLACFHEVEMNCIFETQHRIVMTLAENNILLKIRIIFIEKGNSIKFTQKNVLTHM